MPVPLPGGSPRSVAVLLGCAVMAVVLGACSGREEGSGTDGTVTTQEAIAGTLVFLERTALGADAVAEVELTDAAADGGVAIISSQRIRNPGQAPVHFRLEYPPGRIDPARHYAVQARVVEGGRLIFAADAAYPVITHGNPRIVEVTLVRVGDVADASPSPDEPAVEGTLAADGVRSTYAARFAGGELLSIQEDRTGENGGRAGAEYQFRGGNLVRYLELGLRDDPSGNPVRVELDIAFDDSGELLAVRKSVNEGAAQPLEEEITAVRNRAELLRDQALATRASREQ